ncbi:hypothetical protein PV326_001905 [Microctonus aethiopoides]|nr:hypothetical protein PV326_001905 [Microctonus aethiopoides]
MTNSRLKIREILRYENRRPMVYPTAQFVSANEGESLDIAVEFCAEPSYNKLLWMSSESVYIPGGEERDGVQALELEPATPIFMFIVEGESF